jgi:endonuclease VIII
MPEGDTVHRNAAVLRRELRAARSAAGAARPRRRDGARRPHVERIEAVGKHLLVHIGERLDAARAPRHARPLAAPARARSRARRHDRHAGGGETAFICERAYTAELLRTALSEPPAARPPRPRPARRSARHRRSRAPRASCRHTPTARSAMCCSTSALPPASATSTRARCCSSAAYTRARACGLADREQLEALFATAVRLMRLNLLTRGAPQRAAAPRPQPSSQRLWVYMRNGKPCLDCGTRHRALHAGRHGRSTYFCPRCQPVPDGAGQAGRDGRRLRQPCVRGTAASLQVTIEEVADDGDAQLGRRARGRRRRTAPAPSAPTAGSTAAVARVSQGCSSSSRAVQHQLRAP